MKLDGRDILILALIVIFLLVLMWAGYNSMACVKVMRLYKESGGLEWVCESCRMLEQAGIISRG